jgi:hypothetical protein
VPRRLSKVGYLTAFSVLGTSAGFMSTAADTADVQFFGDARLRYQTVTDDNFSRRANALTQVLRLAGEVNLSDRFFVLVEGEAVGSIVGQFNDGSGEPAEFPIIVDPDGVELNRLQFQARLTDSSFITIGRQTLALDDQRFIGATPFRQNQQTYDGAHLAYRFGEAATIQAGYFNRVNRPFGFDVPNGRFRGDSYFVNASIKTPIGRLGSFHYALDLETGPANHVEKQINTASSQTTGVRLDGRWHKGDLGADWEFSYAYQSDFADNPNDYSADYWLAGARAFIGPLRVGARLEILGGDEEQAFQTPAGTLRLFQGDANVFLNTPLAGIQEFGLNATWEIGHLGPLRNVSAFVRQQWFDSDIGSVDFGTETDVRLSANYKGFQLGFGWARYDAQQFAQDTTRLFFQVSKRF